MLTLTSDMAPDTHKTVGPSLSRVVSQAAGVAPTHMAAYDYASQEDDEITLVRWLASAYRCARACVIPSPDEGLSLPDPC